MEIAVDGEPVDFAERFMDKSLASSDVPNLASSFGCINASWTLRADLTCRFVTRVLNHVDETATSQCTPARATGRPRHGTAPVRRDVLVGLRATGRGPAPEQGDRDPGGTHSATTTIGPLLLAAPIEDGVLQFTRSPNPSDPAGHSSVRQTEPAAGRVPSRK